MPNGQCSCYAPRPPRYGEFWGGLAGGPFCEFSRCIRLATAGGRSASTLFVSQTEPGYSKEKALKLNREELQKYKEALEHANNRYQIDDTVEQEDGSLVVHVRKQYTDKADVSEYFK